MNESEFRKSLGYKEEIFYHYCSINALYGIVTNKSFWLTALESSNDSKELKLGKEVLDQALNELKSERCDSQYFRFFDRIMEAPKDNNFKRYRPKFKYYGLSFVENKDSLTHWERYGDESKGVCIGINLWMIKHFFENYALPDIVANWLQSSKIYYSYKEQVEYAKSSIMSKLEGFNMITNSKYEEIDNIFSSIYYSTLAEIKPKFKHTGFSDENEFRIYLEEGKAEEESSFYKRNADHGNKELFLNLSKCILEAAESLEILKKNKKYYVFKDGIRSYYSMNLSEIWSDALIKEIIIGPKCFQNKKELTNFIRANDLYGTKVSISKIPIR
ncbi:DUF2971 domain-containing protein [Clostridium botulinum]|uniref:DUF2971 domain-containing protein n=1 Tax=Clostridium botulinum TaxID=1491 RepID=UPI000A1763F4|nr:DUF2971 domain-containing protein [Clostridium botulinum]OSA79386.1 hypothetical protein B2H89_13045 [Clostridium botulinum]